MKRFDILVPDEQNRNGVKKTFWNKVGVAFLNDDGTLSGVVPPGISLSGKWIGREPKPKDNSAMLGMSAKKPYEPDPTDF